MGKGKTLYSLWSFRLGVVRGANTTHREGLLLRNHGGGQEPPTVVPPVKTDIRI
jgi:hypothetical protein